MGTRSTIVGMVSLCLLLSQWAEADLFNDGGVHNISDGYYESIEVDRDPPPAPEWPAFTTVNFGGTAVAGSLLAFENSQVTMNDSDFFYPALDSLYAYDRSRVTIDLGCVGDFYAYDRSQVTLNEAGISRSFRAYDNSQVTVNFMARGGPLLAYDDSRVTINDHGGDGGIYAYGNSRVTVNEGSTYHLVAGDSSRMTINGGTAYQGGFEALDNSQVAITGGQFMDLFRVSSGSPVTMFGSDFAVYNDAHELLFSGYGDFAVPLDGCLLTGTLARGDLLEIWAEGDGRLSFVPLPGAAVLGVLGLGFAGWRLRRRTA